MRNPHRELVERKFRNVSDAPSFDSATNALASYLELLIRWTDRVDLVSPAPPEVLIERHFVDSAIAWSLIRERLDAASGKAFLDIGSGAGLPGLVFAVLEPARKIYLCEPREKRVMFLKEVKRELGLENVFVIKKRVEDIAFDEVPNAGLTITRALGLEDLFLRESKRLTNQSGYAVVMAGPSWKASETKSSPLPVLQLPYSLPESGAQHQLVVWRFDDSSS